MKKLIMLILFSIFSISCQQEEEKIVFRDYVPEYRWMDREIYLAFSAGITDRNNEFQKQRVREALGEISSLTTLGENYFSFTEVDEALLQPIIEPGQSESAYKSFILVWPDADFNNFVVNVLGGQVPDQNAVTIINSAFKRKFYMIIKASCFVTNSACNDITTQGLRGLVARQLGMLVGMPPKTNSECISDPENVMCPIPNNEQWNDFNKIRWSNSFNNNLETILNNPNYYDENVVQ